MKIQAWFFLTSGLGGKTWLYKMIELKLNNLVKCNKKRLMNKELLIFLVKALILIIKFLIKIIA